MFSSQDGFCASLVKLRANKMIAFNLSYSLDSGYLRLPLPLHLTALGKPLSCFLYPSSVCLGQQVQGQQMVLAALCPGSKNGQQPPGLHKQATNSRLREGIILPYSALIRPCLTVSSFGTLEQDSNWSEFSRGPPWWSRWALPLQGVWRTKACSVPHEKVALGRPKISLLLPTWRLMRWWSETLWETGR